MRVLWVVVAAALLVGCGTETGLGGSGPGSGSGDQLTTQGPVTVLDDGSGAELCLGGVAESYPPQCGGPELKPWDWRDHEGAYEEASGVRWGEFQVVGRLDGNVFTLVEVTPASALEQQPAPDDPPLRTTCPEPAGGWVADATLTTYGDQDAAFAAASRLSTYAGAFIDSSRDPRPPEELDQAMADGAPVDVSSWVVNVVVTDDPAGAEAAIRQVWGGGLSVGTAQHTEDELARIQRALTELPEHLSSGTGTDVVELYVVHDEDGALQARLDEEYGEGLVRVYSALQPVGVDLGG